MTASTTIPAPAAVDTSTAPSGHAGHARLFAPGELTLGLIMPLETYPYTSRPTMEGHLDMARKADAIGISGLWLRDIPFFDPAYGDAGQVLEPLVYISALASVTQRIALGTAGIVLPFREPNLLARQISALDQLSGGRMLAGLSSGDRPFEYPLFGADFGQRAEQFREVYRLYRKMAEEHAPAYSSQRFGRSPGGYSVLPKPPFGRTPTIAIGRAAQDTGWIAANMGGMIVPCPPAAAMDQTVSEWRAAVAEGTDGEVFKPFGIAGFLHLSQDRDHPFQRVRAGFRTGSRSLARFMAEAREAGVNHIALNPRFTDRPMDDVLADIERDILPHFPSLTA
ncbi:TIGR03571 family LLM class oxidoreductase [Novosphingobium beihaiensis]|uniref:TIGR03571 family LLM class oxidoreductase n=1 Tax=Novosphingobium beihaiensis TaxID=2930389 RepID=A0ABT0BRJ7_9SPHN|nr:TIGR03571 family LLM class oxidoreductase [Novosphingobium beihaiensis]MCJ2187669.1 TIGR03571 family LLM class oxidoreductase [Novosphingobium beihaiensis]